MNNNHIYPLRRPEPPATRKVPLHLLPGEKLPGCDWVVDSYYSNGKAYTASGGDNLAATFTVDDVCMVEVQA